MLKLLILTLAAASDFFTHSVSPSFNPPLGRLYSVRVSPDNVAIEENGTKTPRFSLVRTGTSRAALV